MNHRNILEWSVDDLRGLIRSQEQESLVLDYKASPAIGDWTDRKRNELAKDICAFANSAGGAIIIGIGEDEHHKPTILDDGVDTRKASKEAVESALRARIDPRVDRLTIREIPNPARRFHSYFILNIPRSMRAPHMCTPFHTYYKRYNFECVPMEHYEVEDVRRRQSEPSLSLTCSLQPIGDAAEGRREFVLHAGVLNEGSVTARDVLVRLYVPRALVGNYVWGANSFEQKTTYNGLEMHRFDAYLRDGAGPIPVFPKDDQLTFATPHKALHRDIRLRLPERDHPELAEAHIVAQLFAEGMRMRSMEMGIGEMLSEP